MSNFSVAAILGLPTHSPVKENKVIPAAPKNRLRRNRTAFSEIALEKLEDVFETNRYPDIFTREALGRHLDISESRIQVWFQNRRSRGRRSKTKSRAITQMSTSFETPSPKAPTTVVPQPQVSQQLHVAGQQQYYQNPYSYPMAYNYHPAYTMPSAYMMSPYGYYPVDTSASAHYLNHFYGYYGYGAPMNPTTSPYSYIPTMDQVATKETSNTNTEKIIPASTELNNNLDGINLLTEAARKLSSGSFNDVIDLEQRNTETVSDSSCVDSFSRSISEDSNSDSDGDDDDRLCIDLSAAQ